MNDDALIEREQAKALRLAERLIVCTELCGCVCDREWWAPAETADQIIEFDCCPHRMVRVGPEGVQKVVVDEDDSGEGPFDADDLTKL